MRWVAGRRYTVGGRETSRSDPAGQGVHRQDVILMKNEYKLGEREREGSRARNAPRRESLLMGHPCSLGEQQGRVTWGKGRNWGRGGWAWGFLIC